ncbi:hypothetical protein PsorP6_004547 [Peronosclerospora sorghi]|uniref:Uncharacterized protein n=1 Tax=Peronosclerospora sorghi TaxID=230839 RepID=A0ACC0VM70_9STRA|nr:hypothetical protein PsorP6_004547 [Peronosclerospora sorghi]
MHRQSLLTQGLEPLEDKSAAIRDKLHALYDLDDALQAAHQRAKRDNELGEEVVTKYKAFLSCRRQLIEELEELEIPVPWQLRTTIDELELTLTQRREKEGDKKTTTTKRGALPSTDIQELPQTTQSGRVTIAFVGPTLIALVIAVLWYYFFNK